MNSNCQNVHIVLLLFSIFEALQMVLYRLDCY